MIYLLMLIAMTANNAGQNSVSWNDVIYRSFVVDVKWGEPTVSLYGTFQEKNEINTNFSIQFMHLLFI